MVRSPFCNGDRRRFKRRVLREPVIFSISHLLCGLMAVRRHREPRMTLPFVPPASPARCFAAGRWCSRLGAAAQQHPRTTGVRGNAPLPGTATSRTDSRLGRVSRLKTSPLLLLQTEAPVWAKTRDGERFGVRSSGAEPPVAMPMGGGSAAP